MQTSEDVAERAEREKNKGNEAFRSGDFEEALAYYNRSISLKAVASVHNNRAMAYIKLEKYEEAIKDCDCVLKDEPKNIKGLFVCFYFYFAFSLLGAVYMSPANRASWKGLKFILSYVDLIFFFLIVIYCYDFIILCFL